MRPLRTVTFLSDHSASLRFRMAAAAKRLSSAVLSSRRRESRPSQKRKHIQSAQQVPPVPPPPVANAQSCAVAPASTSIFGVSAVRVWQSRSHNNIKRSFRILVVPPPPLQSRQINTKHLPAHTHKSRKFRVIEYRDSYTFRLRFLRTCAYFERSVVRFCCFCGLL